MRQRRAIENADHVERDGQIFGADHALEHLQIGSVTLAMLWADESHFDDRNAQHQSQISRMASM
jgi:hypothetical protein